VFGGCLSAAMFLSFWSALPNVTRFHHIEKFLRLLWFAHLPLNPLCLDLGNLVPVHGLIHTHLQWLLCLASTSFSLQMMDEVALGFWFVTKIKMVQLLYNRYLTTVYKNVPRS
jgi:hypothetical protein